MILGIGVKFFLDESCKMSREYAGLVRRVSRSIVAYYRIFAE